MEQINEYLALIGGAIAIATFFIGRFTVHRGQGRSEGELKTDVKYIRESVARIEALSTSLRSDVSALQTDVAMLKADSKKHAESLARAHKRIDDATNKK